MAFRACRFAALAVCVLLMGGCATSPGSNTHDSDSLPDMTSDFTADAEQWVDSIMASMSLEEQVGQLVMPAVFSAADPYSMRNVHNYVDDMHVGGFILLKGDGKSVKALSDSLKCWTGVPVFMAMDAEWGLGMRLSDEPTYPANGRLGPDITETDMYDYGREIAARCRQLGINMVLGPVVDVASLPSHPLVALRSLGSDPEKVAALACAYARGLEDGNVLSVAKHFPGLGSTKGDTHNSLQSVDRSLQQLEEVDLVPFRAYVDANLSAVMVGHLSVPAIESRPLPAAMSQTVISDLLRGDLGFRGLVLTDAMNMGGAGGGTALAALKAGADIVLAPSSTRKEIDEVLEAVADGSLSQSEVAEKCRRVLFYKYRLAN